MSPTRRPRRLRESSGQPQTIAALMGEPDTTLVDLIDSLLEKGVVVDGEIVLGLADVDLIYVRLGALLVAADRLLEPIDDGEQRPARRKRR